MPSVGKRKQVYSMESGVSPKKRRFEGSNSPVSSPIKGPLQEHSESNSPSFVAKCFYGFKKSESIKPSKNVTPKKSRQEKVQLNQNVENGSLQGKVNYELTQIERLMAERIAASPMKQRLFETCSMAEFKKVYRDEYRELEELVRIQSNRVTRRASRIMCKRSEDSETDGFESSDDEEIFEVNNNGLDDEYDENEEYLAKEEAFPKEIESDKMSKTSPISKAESKSTGVGQSTCSKPCTPNHKTEEADKVTRNSGSGGRKFFKTRTPVDNSKLYGVVCGKGFNLKVVPKTLQTLFDKKAKQKKSSQQSSTKKANLSPKSPEAGEITHKETSLSTQDSPDSSATTPASGFWFAPGFLSPEPSADKGSMNDDINTSEVCYPADTDLSLNKSNKNTYEKTPPKKNVFERGPSPSDKTCIASNSEDALDCEQDGVGAGSDELFSSPDNDVPDKLLMAKDQKERKKVETNGLAKSSNKDICQVETEAKIDTPDRRLFPVFTRRSARLSVPAQPKKSPMTKTVIASPKDPNQTQMFLDAGQKKFGATQCPVCNMVYCHADPEDEAAHDKFHQQLLKALKYPGWKKDRVIQEYPEDLGQVHLVLTDDPKYIKKKVEEVNLVMCRELGFPDNPSSFTNRKQKVFLYIYEKEIAGCCIAEPIKEGFRTIPGDLDTNEISGQRPWRCSEVPEAACVGISRLWVAASHRKTGVATKLVDSVRQWFDYGTLTPLHKLAFSDPTPDGRKFAQKYMKSNTFLVYKYNSNH